MAHAIRLTFACIWLAWIAYWIISARGVKPVQRHESLASRAAHVVPLLVAVALLSVPAAPGSWPSAHWLAPSAGLALGGAVITLAGLGVSVWARRVLGANWSATVTVKDEHELITGGPYQYVRHPIYSGVLLALAGSGLASGEWRGLLAVLIAAFAFRRKWRLEERWMRETFGTAYSEYAARTPALIPRIF